MTQRTSFPVPTFLQSIPFKLPRPRSNNTSNHLPSQARNMKIALPIISIAACRFANLYAGFALHRTDLSEMISQQGGPYGRT